MEGEGATEALILIGKRQPQTESVTVVTVTDLQDHMQILTR